MSAVSRLWPVLPTLLLPRLTPALTWTPADPPSSCPPPPLPAAQPCSEPSQLPSRWAPPAAPHPGISPGSLLPRLPAFTPSLPCRPLCPSQHPPPQGLCPSYAFCLVRFPPLLGCTGLSPNASSQGGRAQGTTPQGWVPAAPSLPLGESLFLYLAQHRVI